MMLAWLKRQWRAFRKSRPGVRFGELYERREHTPHARLKKALFFGLGLVAIVLGIVTYATPFIPSEPFILFGIAAIAQATWYGARALDWLELKLRVLLRPFAKIWRKLPRWARVAFWLLWCGLAGFGGYGVYRAIAD